MRRKLMLAAALGVGSVAMFGAAALGAFGPDGSASVVSAVALGVGAPNGAGAPAAPTVMGVDRAGDKLKQILDGLVRKGVITAQQQEAIVAAAKDASPKQRRTAKVVRDFLGESAKYLGLEQRDLVAKLNGTTLGKLADATPNKSKAGLVTALSLAANGDITTALADKKITDEQAQKLRDGLAAGINKFVDRTWSAKPAAPRSVVPNVKAFLGDMLQIAREYLGGARLEDVNAALRSGKSLGDIANERGQGRDGLVAALTLAANTRIEKAVAENRLTADQAATLKAKVTAEIASFVDRKYPAKSTTTKRTTTKTP